MCRCHKHGTAKHFKSHKKNKRRMCIVCLATFIPDYIEPDDPSGKLDPWNTQPAWVYTTENGRRMKVSDTCKEAVKQIEEFKVMAKLAWIDS
jgi:hypothetical protein